MTDFSQFWDLSERTNFALVHGIHVIAAPRQASTK
jgi:hypothetical protein